MRFDFAKSEGAGNDFILTSARSFTSEAAEREFVAAVCDRRKGIGADGVIFLSELAPDHWKFDYVNADGSRSFCGNGSRAAFLYLRSIGKVDNSAWLEACDGNHRVAWCEERQLPGVELNPVKAPEIKSIFLETSTHADFLDTGSPHHLEWLAESADLRNLDVATQGCAIRNAEHYAPTGTNANFVRTTSDPTTLQMRTFERGVEAETLACGTGATAAAIADFARRGGPAHRKVEMAGGTLEITFDPPTTADDTYKNVWLWGPAREVFRGTAELPPTTPIPSPSPSPSPFLFLFLFAFLFSVPVFGNIPLTDQAQISVLTGSPGQEVYSSWGHTAIRLFDPGAQPVLDLTFNYGTFNFGPGFYPRFVKGHLDYRLSVQEFAAFQSEYLSTGRGLIEQPLDLAPVDVQAMADYLAWNSLPENRVYRYEFFGDNCSSRVLRVLAEVFGERWDANCAADPGQNITFRRAIEPYIAGLGWVRVGIDFILGARADRPMAPCESSFLPDGLMAQLSLGTLDGQPIAGPGIELVPPENGWFARPPQPIVPPWVVGLAVLSLTAIGLMTGRKWLARLPLIPAGMLGVLLTLMWFTDHSDTWWNVEMAWASPLLLGLLKPKCWNERWGRNLRRAILVTGSGIGFVIAISGGALPGVFWLGASTVALALEPWTLLKAQRARASR
jgi:diaminopimelate epimerase